MKIIKKRSLIYIGIILAILVFVFSFSPIFQEEKNSFASSFKNILNDISNGEFLYRDVQACYNENNYQETIKKAQEFLSKYPKSNKADIVLLSLGLSQQYSGNTENALSSLIKLTKDYPKSENTIFALFRIAKIHLKINPEEAEKYFNIIIEKYPEDFELVQEAKNLKAEIPAYTYILEAENLFNDKKCEEALVLFQNFKEKYFSLLDRSQYFTALCYRCLGKEDLALTAFQKTIDDYPESDFTPSSFIRMAEIYFNEGDFENTEKYCERILKEYPYAEKNIINQAKEIKNKISAEILFQEAEILFQETKYQEALEKYQQLFSEYPDFERIAKVLLRTGDCQKITGKRVEALLTFQKIISDYTKTRLYLNAYFKTAEIYFENNEYEKAEEYCNRILENHSIAPEDLIKRTNLLLDAIEKK